jgi:hypothetical protein
MFHNKTACRSTIHLYQIGSVRLPSRAATLTRIPVGMPAGLLPFSPLLSSKTGSRKSTSTTCTLTTQPPSSGSPQASSLGPLHQRGRHQGLQSFRAASTSSVAAPKTHQVREEPARSTAIGVGAVMRGCDAWIGIERNYEMRKCQRAVGAFSSGFCFHSPVRNFHSRNGPVIYWPML